jgi:hypothetical protein
MRLTGLAAAASGQVFLIASFVLWNCFGLRISDLPTAPGEMFFTWPLALSTMPSIGSGP